MLKQSWFLSKGGMNLLPPLPVNYIFINRYWFVERDWLNHNVLVRLKLTYFMCCSDFFSSVNYIHLCMCFILTMSFCYLNESCLPESDCIASLKAFFFPEQIRTLVPLHIFHQDSAPAVVSGLLFERTFPPKQDKADHNASHTHTLTHQ